MAVYKKSAERRKNILLTMERLVLEVGYGKTGIKDVADALNVPRSLIYYYFENKQSIMREIYKERFSLVNSLPSQVHPQGQEPLTRMMLGYLFFFRYVLFSPLFTEYIVTAPHFAALGIDDATSQIEQYYDDSREAFKYYGKPTDGKEFLLHVLAVESIGRALITSIFYNMAELYIISADAHHGKCANENLPKSEYGSLLKGCRRSTNRNSYVYFFFSQPRKRPPPQ